MRYLLIFVLLVLFVSSAYALKTRYYEFSNSTQAYEVLSSAGLSFHNNTANSTEVRERYEGTVIHVLGKQHYPAIYADNGTTVSEPQAMDGWYVMANGPLPDVVEQYRILSDFPRATFSGEKWVSEDPVRYIIPKLEFLGRFLPGEIAAIETSTEPALIMLRKRVDLADEIDTRDFTMVDPALGMAPMDLLVLYGVMNATRADEVGRPRE